MLYTQLKTISTADVLKAADRLANLAMNLAFRSVAHRDCSIFRELTTDQLRRLPADLRQFFAIKKVKDADNYEFSEKKLATLREKLGLTELFTIEPAEDKALRAAFNARKFEAFVAAVVANIAESAKETILTDDEVKGKAAKAMTSAIRAAFRAGFTKAELGAMLAKVEIEARDSLSQAPANDSVAARPALAEAV